MMNLEWIQTTFKNQNNQVSISPKTHANPTLSTAALSRKQNTYRLGRIIVICSIVGSWLAIVLLPLSVHAQVVTDGTVGSAVTLNGPNVTIAQDLGTVQGTNLFHSFQSFNIQSNGSATFTGADNISNVISRVTGGDVSTIEGTLRSTIGNADFYFINPAGVVFSSGAQVDVPASFHVSTADELRFSDGAVYSTTNPETSTLTIVAPEAFGFLGQSTGSILIDQAQLEFQSERAVSMVSSDIVFQGGGLIVDGGDIRIVAQGNNASAILTTGNTVVNPTTGSLSVADSVIDGGDGGGNILLQAGDMLITDNTVVRSTNTGDVFTNGSDIEVIAGDITISNGGSIFSDSQSTGRGGDIQINASGQLNIVNGGQISGTSLAEGDAGTITVNAEQLMIDGQFTGILNGAAGSGGGGDIQINTSGQLNIVNGGLISGASFAEGDAGNINVNAEQMMIDGRGSDLPTGILIRAGSSGAGGDIQINTSGQLNMVNGGQISGASLAEGDAGNINVNAEQMMIDGRGSDLPTGIINRAGSPGAGGEIQINTSGQLNIVNGGAISGSSFAEGDAGNINVNAEQMMIDGRGSDLATGIFNAAGSSGAGGDIQINASGQLNIVNAGQIRGNSVAEGDAGNINVNAEQMMIDGRGSDLATGIFNAAGSSGAGGEIQINTSGQLNIVNGALISSSSFAEGDAGNINVNAEHLMIDGQDSERLTGILSQSNESTGAGGDIAVYASLLTMAHSGLISSSSLSSGDAGRITVNADHLLIDGQESRRPTGLIGTAQGLGAGGDIEVSVIELTLINGGQINSSSFAEGAAGTLTVNAEQLIIVGQESSFRTVIISEARGSGAGGDIQIDVKNQLTIVNGGAISASTLSEGNAGTLTVSSGQLLIDRQDTQDETGLYSFSFGSGARAGASGDINVTTGELAVLRGGEININSNGGQTGDIILNVRHLLVDGQNTGLFTGIDSSSRRNVAGSIKVIADYVVLHNGQITTSTFGTGTNGGPISISSDVLALNGGFIQANALSGRGGDTTIDTDAVLASSNAVIVGGEEQITFEVDGPNVIQAVAPDGVNGFVNINAPDVDVSGSLLAIEPRFVDITGLAFDPCAAFVAGAPSTFTVLGRGGLPGSPNGDMSFSLTSELLDQLLDDVSTDTRVITFDRVHSTNLLLPIDGSVGGPINSSRSSTTACS